MKQYQVYNAMAMIALGKKHSEVEKEATQEFIQLLEKEPRFYGDLGEMLKKAEDYGESDE